MSSSTFKDWIEDKLHALKVYEPSQVIKLLARKASRGLTKPIKRITWRSKYSQLLASDEFEPNSVAVMTVLILRENALFLDEWIQHHLALGVDHFVIYDNSKVNAHLEEQLKESGGKFKPGKVNRHGTDFSKYLSVEEAEANYQDLEKKYAGRLTRVDWSPRDKENKIGHFQTEAVADFVKRFQHKYDFAIHMDVDEFLVSRSGITIKNLTKRMAEMRISAYYIYYRYFESRFFALEHGKQVRELIQCHAQDFTVRGKTLFRISAVIKSDVHSIKGVLNNLRCSCEEMIIYHYSLVDRRGCYEHPEVAKLAYKVNNDK